MRHHIRAVLFDCDSVVVDTSSCHFRAWERIATEYGWEMDPEMGESITGLSRMECLQRILAYNNVSLSDEHRNSLASRKNAYCAELLCGLGECDLSPAVAGFLDELKRRGVKLALYSLCNSTGVIVGRLRLDRWFDTVVTGADMHNAEWSPAVFETCSRMLHVPAFHCLVVENIPAAIRAAQSARMKVVGAGQAGMKAGARDIIEDYRRIDVDFLLDSGRPERFREEPWNITQTAVTPARSRYWESLFALTNGLLGLRGTHDEDEPELRSFSYPGMFVNGIYGYKSYRHAVTFPGFPSRFHVMLNLADWRIVNMAVDGERFSLFCGKLSGFKRTLDMKKGVVERTLVWNASSGRRVRMRSTRLVSMTRRHCAALRVEVTPLDAAAEVRFESRIDASAVSGELGMDQTMIVSAATDDAGLALHVRPVNADADVGMAFMHVQEGGVVNGVVEIVRNDTCFTCDFPVSAGKNETVVLEKYAAFYSNIETGAADVVERARSEVFRAAADGFDALAKEQEAFWADYWARADIEIEGNVGDQQALRFNLFHLRQSNPEDDRRSIGANGMTGDKYRGHVFWDTEMYLVPFFIYTQPEIVRPLLMYRYAILDMARQRAREMDGQGALYAWNSISGEECGVVFEASTAEYHLLSAIARAIHRYVEATGDRDFLMRYGAEILFETARFWASRGNYIPVKNNAFCINVVCGPDEYGCGVNNNCYTNVMAQWHLRYAAEVYEWMRAEVPSMLDALAGKTGLVPGETAAWQTAADRMYVPFNRELGIHEQDDSFLALDPVDMTMVPRNTDIREQMHPLNLWRMQVAKQADVVLLMFVQGHQFSLKTKRANYEFYEPRTCHGSSLSACIHAVIASETGKHDEAYDYFRESLMMDLNDFKDNTGGGMHMACLGGTWIAVVNGFAGMRDYPDGLHFAPFLPPAWKSCRFEIVYRASRIRVHIMRNESRFELLEGPDVTLMVREKRVELTSDNRMALC